MRLAAYILMTCSCIMSAQANVVDVFEPRLEGSYLIRGAQVLNRNDKVGLTEWNDYEFIYRTYLDLDAETDPRINEHFLGLTSQGELMQVLTIQQHTFVRKLSGSHCLKEFAVMQESAHIIVLDCDSHVWIFDQTEWARTNRTQAMLVSVLTAALGTTLGAGTTLVMMEAGFADSLSVEAQNIMLLSLTAMAGLGSFMTGTASGLLKYERANKNPSGLKPLGIKALKLIKLKDSKLLADLASQPSKVDFKQVDCDSYLTLKLTQNP